jgi:chemotaxis protein MotB
MARHREDFEGYGYDEDPRARKRSRGVLGWVLFVLLLAACAAFVIYMHVPERRARYALAAQTKLAQAQQQKLEQKLKAADARLAALEHEGETMRGELAQTLVQKQAIENELKKVQGDLSKTLEPEIEAGNVRIKRRNNELVVDLADQILFDTGQAELSERGKQVLSQVGKSLVTLEGYGIQVGGHTDSTRVASPTTQERFPTNWELSAARATNVVRFLEDQAKIPGERLVAAGFSQFRPSSSNATTQGRKKNRRIELVLIPRAKDPDEPVR